MYTDYEIKENVFVLILFFNFDQHWRDTAYCIVFHSSYLFQSNSGFKTVKQLYNVGIIMYIYLQNNSYCHWQMKLREICTDVK